MPSFRKATTRIWGSTDRAAVRRGACLVAAASVAVGVMLVAADGEPAAPNQAAGFMRMKLAHSADVLEGLSLEDYDLIAKGAQALSLASRDSNWQLLQTEDYLRQSMEFRRACDGLRRAAKEENLDAAVLAWMDVTMKCVQCHRYVRDERPVAAVP
jgi:hypothetical protein